MLRDFLHKSNLFDRHIPRIPYKGDNLLLSMSSLKKVVNCFSSQIFSCTIHPSSAISIKCIARATSAARHLLTGMLLHSQRFQKTKPPIPFILRFCFIHVVCRLKLRGSVVIGVSLNYYNVCSACFSIEQV